MKKIGLLGGMSWVSTIDYYRLINEGINEKLGGLQFAECIIYSLNFADIHQNGWEHSFELLKRGCEKLKLGGAEAIVLCANTAHLYADKLQNEIKLPIIHIVSSTAEEILKYGLKKVALLGTKYTMEMGFYQQKLQEYGIDVIVPASMDERAFIQQTLRDELGKGIVKQETKKKYISMITRLLREGAQGIVLGCTEIPLLMNQEDFSVPVFDTTSIHANAIVKFALSSYEGI
ncbi:aspartate/glutamate racemase family protein [Pedobacter sp. ASV28]|uniref:aspartate/glutamate racemase family protein n=1 Tax=Pedobacter sp. ASV28 TaxID=2795123 RepID=UPI0018EB101A|nr:aspartate/glutamate racemase family protein [Pedobacter sp. ASV28]